MTVPTMTLSEEATSQPSSALRLGYYVSHPIQYQAPLLRRIAQEEDIDLTVLFGSDFSVRSYKDEGFGVEVAWDVPLLEGYRSEFLKPFRDKGGVSPFTPISRGMMRRASSGARASARPPGHPLCFQAADTQAR